MTRDSRCTLLFPDRCTQQDATMRRLLSVIAAVLLGGLLLPWLDPGTAASGPVIAAATPRTLDPCQASSSADLRLLAALFEPLVRLDPATLRPVAALAEHWQVQDGLVWRFTLRAARWHDGSPVTAAQMRDGLLRHRLLRSPMDSLLLPLLADDGIVAVDERTLLLTTHRPVPHLLELLAVPVFVPLHPSQRSEGTLGSPAGAWADPIALIGNGPLQVVGFRPRAWYDLAPAPAYAGPHTGRGPVRVLTVDDPAAQVRLFLAGQVDAALNPSPDAVLALRAAGDPRLHAAVPSWGTEFLRVRAVAGQRAALPPGLAAALGGAIDRTALCTHLLGGTVVPATTLVPATVAARLGYPLVSAPPSGLAAARAALTKFGPLPPIEVLAPSSAPERVRLLEAVIDVWRRDLGVDARLTVLTGTVLRSRERAVDYDLCRGNWVGDFLDPITFLDLFRTGAGGNRTGWSNPAYDALLDQAAAQPAQRLSLLAQAETLLLAQGPVIPLHHNSAWVLVRDDLEGVSANALELMSYQAMHRR